MFSSNEYKIFRKDFDYFHRGYEKYSTLINNGGMWSMVRQGGRNNLYFYYYYTTTTTDDERDTYCRKVSSIVMPSFGLDTSVLRSRANVTKQAISESVGLDNLEFTKAPFLSTLIFLSTRSGM